MSQAGSFNDGTPTPGTVVVTLTGNTGGPVGPDGVGNINIVNANTTVDIAGNAGTNTLTQDFGLSNLILGDDASAITTATNNVGLGLGVLASLTSSSNNVCLGNLSGDAITSGGLNTLVGASSGSSIDIGQVNTIVGASALRDASGINTASNVIIGVSSLLQATVSTQNTIVGTQCMLNALDGGQNNVIIGYSACTSLDGGDQNIIIGANAGDGLAGAESNNILIGSTGIGADNNTIRIGTQGAGIGQQNTCFIAGITGVTVSNAALVTLDTTTGQLGTTDLASFPWTVVAGAAQVMAVNNGYIANNAGTINFSLPASSVVGDVLRLTGINNATGIQITQAAGQQIFFGTSSTTLGAAGTLTSSATRDSIEMVCVVANTTWNVISSIGNWTVV